MLYSVITLQTAYLKAHYPIYFFKALLNQNINDYGILNKYIMDAQNHNVKISIPNINTSERNFSVKNNEILFGLEAIKGIGNKLVDQILEERDKNGTFKNLKDFNSRVNCSISQNVSLIKAGAIPCKNKRNYMNGYVESLIEYKEYKPVSTLPSNNVLQEKYNIVFNKNEDKIIKLEKYNKLKKEEHYRQFETKKSKHLQDFNEKYLSNEDLWEFETLSIFLTNNPFEDSYKYITPVDECKENSKCVIIGVISNITKKKDKNGKQFAFVNIYSTFGINDITFWHQQYKDYEEQIKRGNQVAILCKKTDDNRLIAEKLKPYAQWILDISSKKPIQN
jgi:DNA polymerase-3 subunit alpha